MNDRQLAHFHVYGWRRFNLLSHMEDMCAWHHPNNTCLKIVCALGHLPILWRCSRRVNMTLYTLPTIGISCVTAMELIFHEKGLGKKRCMYLYG